MEAGSISDRGFFLHSLETGHGFIISGTGHSMKPQDGNFERATIDTIKGIPVAIFLVGKVGKAGKAGCQSTYLGFSRGGRTFGATGEFLPWATTS